MMVMAWRVVMVMPMGVIMRMGMRRHRQMLYYNISDVQRRQVA
jgi:hypothetical protein